MEKIIDAILINGKPYFIESSLNGFIGSFDSLSKRILDSSKIHKFNKKDGFITIEDVKNYVLKNFKRK